LRQRITQGAWAIGERLPTEPELSAELGISRNTVREAMRVLAFSGLIEIRQGDGSYLRSVTDPLGACMRCPTAPWSRPRKPGRSSKWRPSAWPPCAAPSRSAALQALNASAAVPR
jgi:DNA-binding transcriptional MocR family regulator